MTAETDALMSEEKTTVADTTAGSNAGKTVVPRILANYAGGRWVSAQTSGLLDLTNPASGEILARVPLSGVDEVEGAVAAASAA
jgi:hypothetical protein